MEADRFEVKVEGSGRPGVFVEVAGYARAGFSLKLAGTVNAAADCCVDRACGHVRGQGREKDGRLRAEGGRRERPGEGAETRFLSVKLRGWLESFGKRLQPLAK